MLPRRAKVTSHYWAAKSDQTNLLDGRRVTLNLHWWKSPKHEHGRVLMLFKTRRECRAWIEEHYGYIRNRPDLLAEPHCWRVPVPVKVIVAVTEIMPWDNRTRTPFATSKGKGRGGAGITKPASKTGKSIPATARPYSTC